MRLKNKVAIITGGNSGIGLATARVFLAEGAKVAITGRNPKTLAAAVEELGGDVLALQVDVTDVAATEKAFAEAAEKLGNFDVVFANAGIAGETAVGKTTLEQFEAVVRTNFTAVFFTVQAALPHLNDGASVILNGSVHAVLGIPGYSAYAGTKGAVRAMTRNCLRTRSARHPRQPGHAGRHQDTDLEYARDDRRRQGCPGSALR